MLRERCAGCLGLALDVFADLGETPLADVFEDTAAKAEALPRYRLRAALCRDCGLAQLNDVIDDDLLYGADYGFRTGGSPSSLPYMRNLALYADYRAPAGEACDIGCNDGTLLAALRELGRPVFGIDPSAAAADAIVKGIDVHMAPFTARLARAYARRFRLITAVNVAAHVADPHDFLDGLGIALADDGVAVVEFQYLPDLLAGGMFDLIYHEHRFFYTVDSFSGMAAEHGLHVQAVKRTPAQGGSMRVMLKKQPVSLDYWPGWMAAERRRASELADGFQARADYAIVRLQEIVSSYATRVHGYAASAKSCTLLNRAGFGPKDLHCVVDATESKWGRFTPGTGILIVPPGSPPYTDVGAFLLLASNYLSGVLRRERHERGFTGDFIVPLPLPVIV